MSTNPCSIYIHGSPQSLLNCIENIVVVNDAKHLLSVDTWIVLGFFFFMNIERETENLAERHVT